MKKVKRKVTFSSFNRKGFKFEDALNFIDTTLSVEQKGECWLISEVKSKESGLLKSSIFKINGLRMYVGYRLINFE